MDALATGMEVMVGGQTMIIVIDVGAARLMRLRLHGSGCFGVGGARIF